MGKCKRPTAREYNLTKVLNLQNVPMNEAGTAKHEGYVNPTEIDFIAESGNAPWAWIMSRGFAVELPAYREGKVVIIRETFLPVSMSFGYPKNSSLAMLIDHQLIKMRETGIIDLIQKKYTTQFQ